MLTTGHFTAATAFANSPAIVSPPVLKAWPRKIPDDRFAEHVGSGRLAQFCEIQGFDQVDWLLFVRLSWAWLLFGYFLRSVSVSLGFR